MVVVPRGFSHEWRSKVCGVEGAAARANRHDFVITLAIRLGRALSKLEADPQDQPLTEVAPQTGHVPSSSIGRAARAASDERPVRVSLRVPNSRYSGSAA